MSKKFYVEFDRGISYKLEQMGYIQPYETTIDGYKQALKDLKVYKANLAKYIADLEAKLSLTEKALELACETLRWGQGENDIKDECQEYIDYHNKIVGFEKDTNIKNYFKTKAKEIMKSE